MTARETPTNTTRRLERQHELLLRLGQIADRQASLVEDDRAPELLALMAERQTLIDEVVALGRRVERDLAQSPPNDPNVEPLLRRVEAEAARLAERDAAHLAALEARRDRLAGEMAELGRGRSAMHAYANRTGEPTTRFQDTEA